MTLTVLASGKFLGTNAALPNNNRELLVIYTVPVGQSALLKEIMVAGTELDGNFLAQIYILKSGQTDPVTTNNNDLGQVTSSDIFLEDAIPLHALFGNASGVVIQQLQQNMILEAGDQIKFALTNGTGAAADMTIRGIRVFITADLV